MHFDPKCSSNSHVCKKVCISENCVVSNPFICEHSGCSNGHSKDCTVIYYKKLVRQFHKIQGLFTQQILNYQQRIETTFRGLMEGLQKEFLKFRQEFEYMQITTKIEKIYEVIRNNSEKNLTGRTIAAALKEKPLVGSKLKLKNELTMRLQKQDILKTYDELIHQLPPYYSLKQQIQTDDGDGPRTQNRLREIDDQFMKKKKQATGLFGSYFSEFEKILNQDIYNIHLLYRATQNNFDAKKFHEKCDGAKNTVTIAKTEYGNIIMGYCVFPWQSPPKWVYKQDTNDQCFLYSPSEGLRQKKFTPFKTKFAIGMHREYGPSFGDDFVIYDKANNSKNCWSNFPDVYVSKKVRVPHNFETIKAFVGVQDHFQKFNLMEWQVFKISFGPNEEIEPKWKKSYRQIK